MKLENYTGAMRLRWDHDLKVFDEIISLDLDTPNKARATGKKMVAKGPLSPVEVIYAADALACDITTHDTLLQSILNERSNMGQKAIEAGISPEISPWNLVTMGAVLNSQSDVALDLYSTACGGFDDQLIKGFQVMAQAGLLPLRFWEVPRYDPEAESWALAYLEKELKQLFEWMGSYTGKKVTEERLYRVIYLGNLLRGDMVDIHACLAMPKVPIAALEYYLVQMMMGDYAQDPEGLHMLFRQLLLELQRRVNQGQQPLGIIATPVRVYVMGDETQELHLFNAIEDHGGVMVGCDFRLPLYYALIDEDTAPLSALARWIWNMPNNMSTVGRVTAELNSIKKQKPEAVIISNVLGSRHLPGAERLVRDLIKEKLGIPVLSVETSLPQENMEKVDYQVRAFLETIK